jgi:hypothetical protein
MEGGAKIRGLDDALRTLEAAFPNDPKKQQRMVHGAMGASSRKSFLPIAKQLALRGDSSGALSESLKVRVQPKRKRIGKAGGMEIVPVRYNKKAMALYIQHYFTGRGKNPTGSVVIDGIRHGHLVEFGHDLVRGGRVIGHVAAQPYLWPAARAGSGKYRAMFADELKKRIESTVRREAKKRANK